MALGCLSRVGVFFFFGERCSGEVECEALSPQTYSGTTVLILNT